MSAIKGVDCRVSRACLEKRFVLEGAGAVILLFRLEYKTSVICHNVNTQNVKIARRDILGRVVQSLVKITQGKHEN